MSSGLSPHVEHKIAEALASGLYPSREALIEAGVEQLLDEQLPMIPEEHEALVAAAIESSNAGRSAEMSRREWDELHQLVNDIAAGKQPQAE
jgi:Arc/MetJ-type ribon-helix-helix transcriptional regulator